MSNDFDFRLDGFEPADADSAYAEQGIWPSALTILAEHHEPPNGSPSYVVAHDSSATWAVPDDPQILAIKVTRDHAEKTFTFKSAYHATLPFAQNWLTEHGCPPEQIAQIDKGFMKPADDLTTHVEHQIRTSGKRYEVLATRTSDYDPCEAWTLTRDSNAAQSPIRLFLDEGHPDGRTYTMREGAFADEDAARHWLDDRSRPLPQPPENRGEAADLRTRAALTRSAGTSTITTAPDARSAPSAGTAQRPATGRSV
ncbi:glycosyl hydrolase [Streptomyces sp. NPDC088554]|uniref:glycosyl hydrolase n=1 Tax=Streptomyces sp. NPDC088554 TaxID=3365865 RepID=UPI00381859C5